LTADDALSKFLYRVSADARPAPAETAQPHEAVYAVFDEAGAGRARSKYLGLVDGRRAALFPQRIFADLLPDAQPSPASADTPLDEVQRRLLNEAVYAVPVFDDSGAFVGAVTRDSLLAALYGQATEAAERSDEARRLNEQQRNLIAFEIHDGLVQYAVAARMHLQSFAAMAGEINAVAADELTRGMKMLDETIREARQLIHSLYPPSLDQADVTTAIRELVEQRQSSSGLTIEFVAGRDDLRLPKPIEASVFRVVQEALSNAIRHSGSDRALVRLERLEDRVRVEVRDWGCGFDPLVTPWGHGLTGIRHRARVLNGEAVITSAPGKGATISVEFPVVPADDSK
jgi:signal transduction histidine kinase